MFIRKFLFVAVFLASQNAWPSFIDTSPPVDGLGHWEVDLYDASGNQRGTNANPFFAAQNGSWTNACTQSGTWNITNISGTLSLPANAAQETGGNLDDIDLNTDNLNLAQASTTSGQHGPLIQGAVTTANPSYTTGQTNPLSLTLLGGIRTDISSVNGTATVTAGVSGLQAIGGNIASSSADSGYPVKIGSVYNSALPTPSSGNRVDTQANQFGETTIQFRNKYRYITGNSTTTVKSGSGRLHSISINNNTTGGTVTVYDNTAGSGTVIALFTVGTPSGGLLSSSGQSGPVFIGPIGLEFSTGLTIVTAGSASNNITVCYQ